MQPAKSRPHLTSRPARTPRGAPLLLLLLVCARSFAAGPLPLERLFQEPSLFGTAPRQLAWSPDGSQLAFSWAEAGASVRSLWLVDASGDNLRRPGGIDADLPPPREFVWLPDATGLLVLGGDRLWHRDLAAGTVRALQRVGRDAQALDISPDGRLASYLRGGDLWIFDLEAGRESALTTLGLPPLSTPPTARYSRPEREIGPGIWGGPSYRWAPDSRRIAVHLVDRRHMRTVPFPNYLAAETAPNPVRRGYPGDANESRQVGLLGLGGEAPVYLALDDPRSHQILDFSWSPRGHLLIDTAADTNTTRRLFLLRSGETTPALLWESPRSTRIYTRFAARFAPGGEDILILGDEEDYYGLYRLSSAADGAVSVERLDRGDSDVIGAPLPVPATGTLYFEATAGNPADRQVFRLSQGDPTPVQLTHAPGEHRAYPAPLGGAVAIVHSDDRSPPELYLLTGTEETAQRVTESPTADFAEFSLSTARYLSAPGSAGDLAVRLLLPADFNPQKRYPVLFGPMYSNTVRNRWGSIYNRVQQLLTQRGYLVAQIDVRGSTGYGREFREAFLNDFAGGDIEDIAAVIAHLRTLDYIDGERLGIWGSSYGGTLTVYTLLTRPGLFAAGVAAAAAVDPYFFGTDDVAIVRRPIDNSGIFERRAAGLVERLEDPLLLVHGLQDQVVPFKTVATLADAFIREGKAIETAFLPGATHAWSREPGYNRYVFQRLIDFFDRHLAAGDAP